MQFQADAAEHKVDSARHPLRYTVQAMLAGAYIGVGVVLMVSAAGPLVAAGDGMAKLVSGLVFGVALTFVVFGGGELVTSNMMTLTQGVAMRSIRWWQGAGTMLFSFTANMIGAFVFGGLVALSGVLHANAAGGEMLDGMLLAKAAESPAELFVRGILCNFLVCLAIWMSARVTSDGVKIALIFAAILAFITSGFEHVVANMTTFAIGFFTGAEGATAAAFGSNMLWVGLGNLVGGGLLIGLAYWFAGGRPTVHTGTLEPAPQTPEVAAASHR
nr:formate/nitrite transporter family protein [Microbacterium thalassium]